MEMRSPSARRRAGCLPVAVFIIGSIAGVIGAAGCSRPSDETTQTPDIQKMHRPLLDKYGVGIDRHGRFIYIQPPHNRGTVQQIISVPPGATMEIREIDAGANTPPGSRSLQIICTLPANEQGQIEERVITVAQDRTVTKESRPGAIVDVVPSRTKP